MPRGGASTGAPIEGTKNTSIAASAGAVPNQDKNRSVASQDVETSSIRSVSAPASVQTAPTARKIEITEIPVVTKPTLTSVSVPAGGGGLAARWQQQMAQQKEEDFQKNRDKLRGRRRGGVQFMDKQIRDLIDEIKRLSGGSGGHLGTITYGKLFEATQDTMPALSATLSVAKKRGVVSYDGDMLMQGVHSNVSISLLKDEIEDTPDFKSIIGAAPIKLDSPAFGSTMCAICSKTVYPMDRISANDKVMHKTCFKCCECNCTLKLGSFAYNGGKFYCETHFQQKFKSGAGYDF